MKSASTSASLASPPLARMNQFSPKRRREEARRRRRRRARISPRRVKSPRRVTRVPRIARVPMTRRRRSPALPAAVVALALPPLLPLLTRSASAEPSANIW